MTKLMRRLQQLEQRASVGDKPTTYLILKHAGHTFALDGDRCIEILAETGYLPVGPVFASLDFSKIPHGLSPEALERHLREHAAEICPRPAPAQWRK
jgi:hypothetical protein